MEVVHHIPIEIIRSILLNLKVKALIRYQSVCKEWRSIIQDDPNFKLFYRGRRRMLVVASSSSLAVTSITTNTLLVKTLFQVIEHPSYVKPYSWWSGIWCSCNGLVLVSVGIHILLWNPSPRCCTKVLKLELQGFKIRNPDDVLSGLCYVSSTGDYKAVLLLRPIHTVMVASLKNKEWRKVSSFPYNYVNFHNTLHWRVTKDYTLGCEHIIYFEAESDEFKELELPTPTPTHHNGKNNAILGLGIIDDCLCMARERWKNGRVVEVLVMKEYGVKKSWVSLFVISAYKFQCRDYGNFTFSSSKYNREVLIWSSLYGSWELFVYDLKTNKLHNLFEDSVHDEAAICSYVQSIVSPHEFFWRDD